MKPSQHRALAQSELAVISTQLLIILMEVLHPASLLLALFMWNIMLLSAWPLRQNGGKKGETRCQMVQRNEDPIRLTDPSPAFWKGVIFFNLIVFGWPIIWLLFSPPADLPQAAFWQIGLSELTCRSFLVHLPSRDAGKQIYLKVLVKKQEQTSFELWCHVFYVPSTPPAQFTTSFYNASPLFSWIFW